MKVLLTGGTGYIGSHTALVLLEHGHEVVALDSLVNSSPESLRRVGELTGRPAQFVQGDIRDQGLVESVLANGVGAVVHFAGLKAVGESVARPLEYFSNNVGGTL
ncbi:MAG TPA: SDR family NAD(P)-dependent oxidoreductase, partial [Lapillicoccus sp.]|uniref:SDR family NAD(P)-dependent oxidoreductase n=1 Tax=Lapillicoccus sp. TaxID=1909287 RepID=UPI002F95E69A